MKDKHSADISFDDPNFLMLLESFPIGILLLDEKDNIKFINQNFYEFGICDKDSENNYIGIPVDSFQFFKAHHLVEDINSLKSGEPIEKELSNFRSLSGS